LGRKDPTCRPRPHVALRLVRDQAKGRRAAGDPNLKLEAPHETDSSQTPRWRGRRIRTLGPLGRRRPSSPVSVFVRADFSAGEKSGKSDTMRSLKLHRVTRDESISLQRGVYLSSAPRGRGRKAPHFGGGLRVAGDVRRHMQASSQDSLALSLSRTLMQSHLGKIQIICNNA
jgi:hypothetical protein